jgi:hypothetical protein
MASSKARASFRRSRAKAASSPVRASPLRKDARRKLLTEEIDAAVVAAHHLQVEKAEFLRLAADRFEAFARRRAARALQDQD